MLSKALARALLGRAAARIAAGLVLPVLSLFPLAGRAAAEKPKPPYIVVEEAEPPVHAGEAKPAPEVPGSPKPPETGSSTPPSASTTPYPTRDRCGWVCLPGSSCGPSNYVPPTVSRPPEPSLAQQVNELRQTCASQEVRLRELLTRLDAVQRELQTTRDLILQRLDSPSISVPLSYLARLLDGSATATYPPGYSPYCPVPAYAPCPPGGPQSSNSYAPAPSPPPPVFPPPQMRPPAPPVGTWVPNGVFH
jgi:hypothetical protein